MKLLYVLAVVLYLGRCITADSDNTISTNKTYVMVDMKTGQTKTSKNEDIDSDANKLVVTTTEIRAVRNDNTTENPVDISNLNYEFSNVTDQTMGVAHKQIIGTGKTTINNGTVKLTIDIFTADGDVTRDDETTTVMDGDVRLSASIDGFTFGENDTKLQIKMMISSPSDPTKGEGMYNLGENATAYISNKVMTAADTYVALDDLSMNGKYFTFKLAKDTSLQISMVLRLAEYKEGGEDPSSAATQSVHYFLLLCSMLGLLKVLF